VADREIEIEIEIEMSTGNIRPLSERSRAILFLQLCPYLESLYY